MTNQYTPSNMATAAVLQPTATPWALSDPVRIEPVAEHVMQENERKESNKFANSASQQSSTAETTENVQQSVDELIAEAKSRATELANVFEQLRAYDDDAVYSIGTTILGPYLRLGEVLDPHNPPEKPRKFLIEVTNIGRAKPDPLILDFDDDDFDLDEDLDEDLESLLAA